MKLVEISMQTLYETADSVLQSVHLVYPVTSVTFLCQYNVNKIKLKLSTVLIKTALSFI